jgi:hypothetical protein
VATFEWKPSVFYAPDGDGRSVPSYGLNVQVVKALAAALNFSVVFLEPPAVA